MVESKLAGSDARPTVSAQRHLMRQTGIDVKQGQHMHACRMTEAYQGVNWRMGTDHNSLLRMNRDMARDKILGVLNSFCDPGNEGKISMESLSIHDPII